MISTHWSILLRVIRSLGINGLSYAAFSLGLSIFVIGAILPQLCWSQIRLMLMKSWYQLLSHLLYDVPVSALKSQMNAGTTECETDPINKTGDVHSFTDHALLLSSQKNLVHLFLLQSNCAKKNTSRYRVTFTYLLVLPVVHWNQRTYQRRH